ncbi:MAG: NAD(P)-dependent oxidoreductase [Candidatus Pacearchaeota archaeon]
MKVNFFETEKWHEDFLKENLNQRKFKIEFNRGKLNEKSWKKAKDADIVAIFVYSKINSKVLEKLPNLKGIVVMATGTDNVDKQKCKEKGIKVMNVPRYGKNTVAEYAFGLILNLSKKIHKAHEKTKTGDFSLDGLQGMDLKNKTLGVIGLGDIGQNTAKIAKGFGMNVIAYDVKQKRELEKKIGFKYSSMNNLLKNSDIISLHVPYNKNTHHLINKESIEKMKEGVLIVNTSRGAVINTTDLIKGLKSEKISGAALDVLEEEEKMKKQLQLASYDFPKAKLKNLLQDHSLMRMDNVLLTPHSAFNTKEAIERILEKTIKNIENFYKK